MSDLVPITVLACGDIAEIQTLVGVPEHVCRLEELGLRSGTRIEMVRSGSPCILRAGGSTICLRGDEQVRVLVSLRKSA